MKKPILIFSLIVIALFSFGQTVFIQGTVNTTGGGVGAGEQIFISTDTINGVFHADTLITDANGNFGDSVYFPPNPNGFPPFFHTSIWDYCSSKKIYEIGNYLTPNYSSYQVFPFLICMTQSQCLAQFYWLPTLPYPNTFHFTNTSLADTNSNYLWDFGDGNTSTLRNPTHTYIYSGFHTPTLTVTNSQGCNSTSSPYDTIFLFTGISAIDAELTDILQPSVAPLIGTSNQVEVRVKNVGLDTITEMILDYRLHYIGNLNGLIAVDTLQLVLAPGDSLDHVFLNTFSPPISASYEIWARVRINNDYNYQNNLFIKTINNSSGLCDAYFGVEQDTMFLNKFYFSDSSSSNITSWFWTFGDGGMSSLQNPTHTYTTAGTYLVTLIAQDTSGGCIDTYSDSVTSPVSYSCYSYYTYSASTSNPFTITFTSQNTIPGLSASWDFGDGTSDTGAVVTHTYTIPGSYPVCLYESGSGLNCMPHCQNLIVGSFPGYGSLIGEVKLQSNLLPIDATVYLIEYDSASQILTAIDTTNILPSGFYSFTNIPYGDYMVKAALNPPSPYYASYLPTYHQSFLFWSQITPIYINSPFNGLLHYIYMIQGSNPGGPGFIGGNVNNGANKMIEGKAPLENVQVILLDDQNNPQGFKMTDFNGDFEFDNLALGSYKLLVELINVPTDTAYVVLDPTNTSSTGTQFTIDNNVAIITTNINDFGSDIESFKVIGNPVNNRIKAELVSRTNGNIQLEIRNVIGQNVTSQQYSFHAGSNIIEMDASSINEGIYFLSATYNNKQLSQKLIIQH